MRKFSALLSLAGLALAWGQARCQTSPYAPMTSQGMVIMRPAAQPMMQPGMIAQGDKPATPQVPAPPAPGTQPQAPATDAFSATAPAGTAGSEGFNPQMLGDSIPYVGQRQFTVNNNGSTFSTSAHAPAFGLGQFKIADNESPCPQDRVFFFWNGYSRVDSPLNGPGAPNIHTDEWTFGAEKTFLDGDASVEIRLPIVSIGGDVGNSTDFGDITLVGKVALLADHECGNCLTAGLAITFPTGPDATGVTGNKINPTIIQPFAGAVYNIGEELYVHGFTSLAIPTDDNEGTLFFADAGVGYKICISDDGWLRQIVPTSEVHFTWAWDHNQALVLTGLGSPDQVVLTEGVHVIGPGHSSLTLGYGFPVTGPRLYANEWIAQLNLRF